MEEWKKYKLGELITLKYGKDHKKLNDGSFPVYGSGGVMRYGNDYIYDDSSILIPRKGSLNNIMFVDKPFWTVDTMFWSIIDQELVLPRFLYYTLCKYDFAGLNVGSAVPSLTVPVIESIEVVIPSIEKQKRILSLLVPLDDKIALNQRINDNLELQAQALYKSWFVDFEPFKDGKFVDSELGMIPEGWSIGDIGTYSKVRSGFAFKSSWWTQSGSKVIKIKNITSDYRLDMTECSFVSKDNTAKASEFRVEVGDLLIAMTGATIGKFCLITSSDNNTYVNQRVGKFFLGNEPLKRLPFLYCCLKQDSVINEIINKGQGSAQPNISGTDIESIKIVLPNDETIPIFNEHLYPMYKMIIKNQEEIELLSTMRDSILPKLMSGELKVNDLNN